MKRGTGGDKETEKTHARGLGWLGRYPVPRGEKGIRKQTPGAWGGWGGTWPPGGTRG